MKLPKRYLITAALPYTNGLKHIGHLAGAYLPADIFVRFLKAQKKEVVFVCGSDEHGTAIPIQASKEGISPQQLIDKYHPIIEENFKDLGIKFDIYHRTSTQLHHQTAQDFFLDLYNKNIFEEKISEQYFDEQKQQFLADRYIKGTCPNCQYNHAFGDQCEQCGKSLSPDDLINPISTLSNSKPIKKSTKHWYLPLQNYESFLQKWILEDHKNDWRNSVVGQCKSWIDGGLHARAVTRDLDWGIKLPIPNTEGKVLYVWFDAPIGYISATKQWAIEHNQDWEKYWKDNETSLIHFIGKDNIVFHCLIFPIMLKEGGFILPTNVPANEFLNLEGDKMSTSRGWSVEMDTYIKEWIKSENGTPQMADVLRYYLTCIAPESKDSEFTWKGFQDANNNELVNNLGNFINRTWVLMHKLCKGRVPNVTPEQFNELDNQLISKIKSTKIIIEEKLYQYKFKEALFEVMELARFGNQYMQKKEPWILAKEVDTKPQNQVEIDICIYLCLQLTANITIFIHPFLPFTADKICKQMKVVSKILEWENAGRIDLLKAGYPLPAPQLIFRKIENEEVENQLNKLNQLKMSTIENQKIEPIENNEKPIFEPLAGTITIDDFAKIDLRIGKIIAAEKVEKADKLLNLTIDLGFETRTILSGIAQHFNPQDIIGQQVTVVANLAPRKMRGIESNGMILMAADSSGKLHFVQANQAGIEGIRIS